MQVSKVKEIVTKGYLSISPERRRDLVFFYAERFGVVYCENCPKDQQIVYQKLRQKAQNGEL